jgi:hypothetical protein
MIAQAMAAVSKNEIIKCEMVQDFLMDGVNEREADTSFCHPE